MKTVKSLSEQFYKRRKRFSFTPLVLGIISSAASAATLTITDASQVGTVNPASGTFVLPTLTDSEIVSASWQFTFSSNASLQYSGVGSVTDYSLDSPNRAGDNYYHYTRGWYSNYYKSPAAAAIWVGGSSYNQGSSSNYFSYTADDSIQHAYPYYALDYTQGNNAYFTHYYGNFSGYDGGFTVTGSLGAADIALLASSGAITYSMVGNDDILNSATLVVNTVATPLPASAWLMLSSMGGLVTFARRRRQLE